MIIDMNMKLKPVKPKQLRSLRFYRHRNNLCSRVILAFGSWKVHGSNNTVAYKDVYDDNGIIFGPFSVHFCNRNSFVRACPNEVEQSTINLSGEEMWRLCAEVSNMKKAFKTSPQQRKVKTQRVNIQDIKFPGYRWPKFSKEFEVQWEADIKKFLQGNHGEIIFCINWCPVGECLLDVYRLDVHFWKEMTIWAAMYKVYADLGGDSVPDLEIKILNASSLQDGHDPEILKLLNEAVASNEISQLIDAAYADMAEQIGGNPKEWAEEHMKNLLERHEK